MELDDEMELEYMMDSHVWHVTCVNRVMLQCVVVCCSVLQCLIYDRARICEYEMNSHVWHVTCVNRVMLQCVAVCCSVLQCLIYAYQTSKYRSARHIRKYSHVPYVNESRHTYKWVMSHMWNHLIFELHHVYVTATHCNTLQHAATHCNMNLFTYVTFHTWESISFSSSIIYYTLQHTATHGNTLQHTATHCNTTLFTYGTCKKQHTAHTATHCNTLQHTATHCNMTLLTYVTSQTWESISFSSSII